MYKRKRNKKKPPKELQYPPESYPRGLLNSDKYMSMNEAWGVIQARGIPICKQTLRNWVTRYNLGFQYALSGKRFVNREKFFKFIEETTDEEE